MQGRSTMPKGQLDSHLESELDKVGAMALGLFQTEPSAVKSEGQRAPLQARHCRVGDRSQPMAAP